MRRGMSLLALAALAAAVMFLSGCSGSDQEAVAGARPGGEDPATCSSASEAGCAVACASAEKTPAQDAGCAVAEAAEEPACAASCAAREAGATCAVSTKDPAGDTATTGQHVECPHAEGEECTCPVTDGTVCPKKAAGTCPRSGAPCSATTASESK